MAEYHKYIFDSENKKFVGKFEEMYANEDQGNYDSWFQEDMRGFKYVLSRAILDQYNFNSILDIGCGKGAFTHYLKKKNNQVLGIDISETAASKAAARYPDIDFRTLKAEDVLSLRQKFDLVVVMEVLSYLQTWREVVKNISKTTDYIFLSLYLPENPIGFVKTFDELTAEVEKHFTIVEKVIDTVRNDMLILAKVRNDGK